MLSYLFFSSGLVYNEPTLCRIGRREFEVAVSNGLKNALDWDGHRGIRSRSTIEENSDSILQDTSGRTYMVLN